MSDYATGKFYANSTVPTTSHPAYSFTSAGDVLLYCTATRMHLNLYPVSWPPWSGPRLLRLHGKAGAAPTFLRIIEFPTTDSIAYTAVRYLSRFRIFAPCHASLFLNATGTWRDLEVLREGCRSSGPAWRICFQAGR